MSRIIDRWWLFFKRVVKGVGEWELIVRVLLRIFVLEWFNKMDKICVCINILKCKYVFNLFFIIDFIIF